MITLNFNNFGGGIVTLNDYQSEGICVLNGKIIVDPTNPAYIAANRLEIALPSDFAMSKSAMSTAVLVSNAPIYRDGTVLHCWIENNKLCIEKLTVWDSYGNYTIFINSAFVTRGYRGVLSYTITKPITIINNGLFRFSYNNYVETDDYISFAAVFLIFPNSIVNGQGPFNLQVSGIATNVSAEIPIIVTDFASRLMTGNKLVVGTFENGNLTFSYPDNTSPMGGGRSFFNFFAVRN
jgi:hypothetical protein